MQSTEVVDGIHRQDLRSLARAITIVENELAGHLEILQNIKPVNTAVTGFTGPPGAGKSTLVNAYIKYLTGLGKKVGVIAIDPTSPFNFGSILGDRIRMEEHFNDPNVYIRSVATRGSLGGLSAKTIEICDLLKAAGFDEILIETVGVGQSEVEIAGLADVCVLVLVPESGDEVQSIKSGIMEIADVFAVNKSDRPGADLFVKNILALVHDKSPDQKHASVVKTVASKNEGAEELYKAVQEQLRKKTEDRRVLLLLEKGWKIIQNRRMRDLSRKELEKAIRAEYQKEGFNFYRFLGEYF